MAQWVGDQGQVKVAKNIPTCGVPPRKPPNEAEKFCIRFRLQDLLNP